MNTLCDIGANHTTQQTPPHAKTLHQSFCAQHGLLFYVDVFLPCRLRVVRLKDVV